MLESPEVIDSDDVQSFNFGANQWSTLTPIPAPTSHSATIGKILVYGHQLIQFAALDDRVAVIGGRWEENNQWALDTIREYDPATDTWTNLAPLPRKLISPVAGYFKSITVDGQLGDYLVVTAGGYDWNQCQTNTWIARVTRDESCTPIVAPQSVPQIAPQSVPQSTPQPSEVPQSAPSTLPETPSISVPSTQSA